MQLGLKLLNEVQKGILFHVGHPRLSLVLSDENFCKLKTTFHRNFEFGFEVSMNLRGNSDVS